MQASTELESWRRFRRLRLFYCDHIELPLPQDHRFPIAKYEMLRKSLIRERVTGRSNLKEAVFAERDDLLGAHDADYVDRFLGGTLGRQAMRRIGFPWSQGLVRRSLASVGATLCATDAALEDLAAGALSGGTHHAFRGYGSGFCVFNDIAVASARLLARGFERVAVLDVDVHQGDGTAEIFAQEPRVLTCSVHCKRNFPLRKGTSDLDIALPAGTRDAEYLQAVGQAVRAVLAFAPQLVFVQAGVDPLKEDRLGRLSISEKGLAERDFLIFDSLQRRNVPVVLTMGGGYAEPIERTVAAHLNTYRVLQAVRGQPER